MSASSVADRLGRLDVLVLTALVWFLAKFLRYAFPPLFGVLSGTYGVSTTALGFAFSGLMVVYASLQFPSGLLADRLGSVRVVVGGALVAAAASLALSVDAPVAVLAVSMLGVGAGTGAHKTVAVRLLARTYPAQTGRALGVLDTVGTAGGVAAPAAVVFVTDGVSGLSWRSLFLAAGVAGVGLAAAVAARAPADPSAGDAPADAGALADDLDLRRYAALFGDRRVDAFVAVTLLFSFAYYGTVAFLPLYLTRAAGLTAASAGLAYSALFAVSVVQLATGEAGDRVGPIPVVAAALALATAALVALLLLAGTAGPLALGGAVVCLGLGAHGYRPVRSAYLLSILPESLAGGGLGVVRTLLMGAGAVAPALVGVLSDRAGFRAAFWLLAAAMGAAAALAALLWLDERRAASDGR
ncbi:MAG: MFS transporter [Haloarculaceae archaeon]